MHRLALSSRAIHLVITCLLLVGALTACGAANGHHTTVELVPDAPTRMVSSDGVPPPSRLALELKLPLDRYSLSIDQIYTVEAGAGVLTARCMRKLGLDWPSVEYGAQGDWRNRRRYGVIELDVAHAFGYHAVPALLAPTTIYNEKVRRYRSLSRAQREAAYNVRDGCVDRGVRELSAHAPTVDRSLLGRLDHESLTRSLQQPAVRPALRGWRRCMRQHGHPYASPLAASADPRWSQQEKATAVERLTATVDVQCQRTSGLIRSWRRSEVRLQRELIRSHDSALRKLSDADDALLEAARALLDTTAPGFKPST
jgi:hypothetical protein